MWIYKCVQNSGRHLELQGSFMIFHYFDKNKNKNIFTQSPFIRFVKKKYILFIYNILFFLNLVFKLYNFYLKNHKLKAGFGLSNISSLLRDSFKNPEQICGSF